MSPLSLPAKLLLVSVVGLAPMIPAGVLTYREPDLAAATGQGPGLFIVRAVAGELRCDVARPQGTRWTLVTRLAGQP